MTLAQSMHLPTRPWPWVLLAACSLLGALAAWLLVFQLLMMTLTAPYAWQWPSITKVTVLAFDPDPHSDYPNVRVTEGDTPRIIRLSTAERVELAVYEDIWLYSPFYLSSIRPTHFRLTPQRLLTEVPAPVLLLALLGAWWALTARPKAGQDAQVPVRTVFCDNFHARAQRFAQEPESWRRRKRQARLRGSRPSEARRRSPLSGLTTAGREALARYRKQTKSAQSGGPRP